MSEEPLGSPDDASSTPSYMALNSGTLRDPIRPEDLGTVILTPSGSFEAGSYVSFEFLYTAGKFGIDDSGSLRICLHRTNLAPNLKIQHDPIIQL